MTSLLLASDPAHARDLEGISQVAAAQSRVATGSCGNRDFELRWTEWTGESQASASVNGEAASLDDELARFLSSEGAKRVYMVCKAQGVEITVLRVTHEDGEHRHAYTRFVVTNEGSVRITRQRDILPEDVPFWLE